MGCLRGAQPLFSKSPPSQGEGDKGDGVNKLDGVSISVENVTQQEIRLRVGIRLLKR